MALPTVLDLAALYTEHRLTLTGWVRRHAPWWLGEDDIDDVVQAVFLRAWRASRRYQDRGQPPIVWLIRIARNLLFDMQRQRHGVRYVGLDDAMSVPATASDLSITLDLRAAVDRLPAQRRAAIVGHYYRDLPYDEVACRLGISEHSAGRSGRLALVDLRAMLREDRL